jgi:sterol desaturase/sphingolipid hydroxylase (fatty acid hydroxylase superfamily)
VAILSWWVFTRFTGELTRAATFRIGWIAELYLHNVAMMLVFAGLPHLRLYIKRAQGRRYKYNPKWLSTNNPTFLFSNQTLDNLFLTLVPGVLIWTGFQGLLVWGYANGLWLSVSWESHPVYSTLLVVLILFWRSIHFYWIHRIIHWKPLYKAVHYVHHKNVNIGPWSGIAMHPVEQAIYFSVVLLVLVIPSHPLHMFFILVHAGLAAATDHSGFERIEMSTDATVGHGSFFHYLHHRYFDCNYGGPGVPLDQWFGSFHDGSPGAYTAMRTRQRRLKDARRAGAAASEG